MDRMEQRISGWRRNWPCFFPISRNRNAKVCRVGEPESLCWNCVGSKQRLAVCSEFTLLPGVETTVRVLWDVFTHPENTLSSVKQRAAANIWHSVRSLKIVTFPVGQQVLNVPQYFQVPRAINPYLISFEWNVKDDRLFVLKMKPKWV